MDPVLVRLSCFFEHTQMHKQEEDRCMDHMTADELLFFEKQMSAFFLYEILKKKITERFSAANIQVKKTQISFSNKHIFACVSFQRVLRKSELPNPYIVLTLGMPYPLESPRAAVKAEPYPGRWTTHIVLGAADEIDDELFTWLSDAYEFANAK